MQALAGNDDGISVLGLPVVNISFYETKPFRDVMRSRDLASARKHMRIQFKAIKMKILYSFFHQDLCEIHFRITVTRADAQYPANVAKSISGCAFYVLHIEIVGVAEAE